MTQRLLVVIVALLAILTAAVLGMGLGRSSDKPQANHAASAKPNAAKAQAQALLNVRTALLSLEAWHEDHGTYKGATVAGLHHYDYGVHDVRILRPTRKSYCIESRVGKAVASVRGPGGRAKPVPC